MNTLESLEAWLEGNDWIELRAEDTSMPSAMRLVPLIDGELPESIKEIEARQRANQLYSAEVARAASEFCWNNWNQRPRTSEED